MRTRNCYKCHKQLTWTNFMFKNYPYGQDYLESLWENNNIEFYCCDCFKKMEWNTIHEQYHKKLQIC